jgi:hypothetical protein
MGDFLLFLHDRPAAVTEVGHCSLHSLQVMQDKGLQDKGLQDKETHCHGAFPLVLLACHVQDDGGALHGLPVDRPPASRHRLIESFLVCSAPGFHRLSLLQRRIARIGRIPSFLLPACREGIFGKVRLEAMRYLDIRLSPHPETGNRALARELPIGDST